MDKAVEDTLYHKEVVDVPSSVILKVDYYGGRQYLHITSTTPYLLHAGGKKLVARIEEVVNTINARAD